MKDELPVSRPIRAPHEVDVEWGDLDSARIVFYPRFFAWADASAHRLFIDGGLRQDRILNERQLGFGLVALSADFHSPARYADRLAIRTSVVRIGKRSFELVHRITHRDDDRPVATVRETRACFDLRDANQLRSADLPADVRAVLTSHLE